MRRRSHRRRRGFTLLEVLLVLAILVIMGSTVAVYLVGAQQRAYNRQALNQMSMFEDMLTDYHLDVGSYPNGDQGLAALRVAPPELANTGKWQGPYAEKDIPLDPWNNPYQYEVMGAGQYRIWSWGADQANGTEDDVIVTNASTTGA
jgi:general secretion pathway protein G